MSITPARSSTLLTDSTSQTSGILNFIASETVHEAYEAIVTPPGIRLGAASSMSASLSENVAATSRVQTVTSYLSSNIESETMNASAISTVDRLVNISLVTFNGSSTQTSTGSDDAIDVQSTISNTANQMDQSIASSPSNAP